MTLKGGLRGQAENKVRDSRRKGQHSAVSSELCESRGERPGIPVPSSPCGLCGHKATLKKKKKKKKKKTISSELRSCVKVEVNVLRRRRRRKKKATLKKNKKNKKKKKTFSSELGSCVEVEANVLSSLSL